MGGERRDEVKANDTFGCDVDYLGCRYGSWSGGWALTWAKLASEKLPTDGTITALPETYFVEIALRSTLLPLVVVVATSLRPGTLAPLAIGF